MTNMRPDEITRNTIKAILDKTNKGKSLTSYGDIADSLHLEGGFRALTPLNKYLDHVQKYCAENCLPCLPVMVVNKESLKTGGNPGEGFFLSYFDNYMHDISISELIENNVSQVENTLSDLIVSRERRRVTQYQDWDSLLKELDF